MEEAGLPAGRSRLGVWLNAHRHALVVLLFAVLSFYTRSWEGDLHGDPVHYAAIAKNMLSTGEWLVPQDAPGVPFTNKPPLMFWLAAASFRVLGATTYAASFWSCAFAVGLCLVTYWLGRRLFGETAGMLAGCMLCLFPLIVLNAIDMRLDSAAAFCTALGVYAVVRADQEGRPRWLLLVGVAAGLGLMVKASGALGAVLLAAVLLAVRRPRWLVHPALAGAVGLAAAIAAPWHVLMLARLGSGFADSYFGREMGDRAVLGMHMLKNLARYLANLSVRTLPWWPFAAYAVVRRRGGEGAARWGKAVSLVWLGAILLVMSLPPKAYDRYLILACPAVALLAGYGLDALLSVRLRAAMPAIVAGYAVAASCLLAVLPVSIHTESCKGFTEARPLLDRLAPGDKIAGYDPRVPSGPSSSPQAWSVRSLTIWYLDRHLVNYASPGELADSDERFVISKEEHLPAVEGAGFEAVMPLGREYWLLGRRGVIGSPDVAPRQSVAVR
jgi:4-amino-4-deoxy-L-arabinose transferase-like glycosyltransferase